MKTMICYTVQQPDILMVYSKNVKSDFTQSKSLFEFNVQKKFNKLIYDGMKEKKNCS